jgi:hypothetical protein
MMVQYLFGVELGLSVATHKPRSPREVTRLLTVFSAQTPQRPVKDKDWWTPRGGEVNISLSSILALSHGGIIFYVSGRENLIRIT